MPFSSPHSATDLALSPSGESVTTGKRAGRALRGLFLTSLIASYIAAGLVQDAANDLRARQLAERDQVTATLLESASGQAVPDASQPIHATTQVPARWTTPDGDTSTGLIAVATDSSVGDKHPIWVDRSGDLATPPLSAAQVAFLAIAVGVGVNATGAVLLFAAYRFIQHRAWQRRLRAWEAEWAEVAPQWSTR